MNGKMVGWAVVIGLAAVGWKVGSALDSDALAMAVGFAFGILAAIPMMLLALVSRNRVETTAKAGDTHYHYHAAATPAQLPLAPKIGDMEYEVASLPGYRAWKVAGQDLIWISKDGTGKEWTRSAKSYFQYLSDYNIKQLENKQKG